MAQQTIYVLHKNGAPSHYIGLETLGKEYGFKVKFREFSIIGTFFKSIFKLKGQKLLKQLVNLGFLLKLLVSKKHKIVLGIAPYDSKLASLQPFLSNHKLYYHTSWSCWDGSFQPKNEASAKIQSVWKAFLETQAKHIFAVTHTAKEQLCKYYEIKSDKVSVVHHSIHSSFLEEPTSIKKPNSFIYYGRLIGAKGIDELLHYFSENSNLYLTLIGKGEKEEIIEQFTSKYNNIRLLPYFTQKQALLKELSNHEFLILNAKKTNKWEELFGMILIEGMAQGVIPISVAHSGPKEIIQENFGFLFPEGSIKRTLDDIMTGTHNKTQFSSNAIQESKKYAPHVIAKKWAEILK